MTRDRSDNRKRFTSYSNPRIIIRDGKLYTVSESRESIYGEDVEKRNGQYERHWEAKRNKLSGALISGLPDIQIRPGMNILYLGASFGTGTSHLSDLSLPGKVYAVELAYEPFLKLLELARSRTNVYPILDDANNPERYRPFVDRADLIYQDISQRNQVQIFLRNSELFPEARYAILVLKLRSITSSQSESKILEDSIKSISGYKIDNVVNLGKFHKGHYLVTMHR